MTIMKSIRNAAAMLIALFVGTITTLATGPAHDNFANAIDLGIAPTTRVTSTNENATKEPGEPNHGFNQGGSSVWYKWTPMSSRAVQITTTQSNFNTLLHVYTGTSVDNLVAIVGSNDISSNNTRSLVTLRPVPGTTYYIAIDGVRIGSNPPSTGLVKMSISPLINRRSADYDGDGATDIAVYRPSDGNWYVYAGGDGDVRIVKWGIDGDIPLAGAFTRNSLRADEAVYRPSTGVFYVRYETLLGIPTKAVQWGLPGDVPVFGNFLDYTPSTDFAVFRPSNGTWYVKAIGSPGGGFSELGGEPVPVSDEAQVQFGESGDIPVPGDFTNDELTDVAVYRPSTGMWYILPQVGNWVFDQPRAIQFGLPGDKPVPGDYDGDGITDPAIYRPSTGHFWILRSTDNQQHAFRWGTTGDIPTAGDFDGDGIFDFAVFRPSTGDWYIYHQVSEQVRIQHFGMNGDIPVTSNVR